MTDTNYQCDLLDSAEPWTYKIHEQLTLRGGHLNRGKRKVIHFMPGTAFGCKIYWPFLSRLAEDYDIFWHDYQGHGDSCSGSGEFDGWQATVDRAVEIIKAMKLLEQYENVVGMGHSYGGCMTIILAAENPEVFSDLVLTDPFMVTEAQEVSYRTMIPMLAEKTRKKDPVWKSEQEFRDYLSKRFMFQNWGEEAIQATLKHNLHQESTGALRLRCPPSIEAGVYEDEVPALWPSVDKLEVQTTIISGNQTVPYFAEAHRLAAELKSNIALIKVEGGHNFMQEYIDDNTEITKGVLDGLAY